MLYAEVLEDFGEHRCKIYPGMRLRDLNKVKQKTHWLSVMLKVDSNGHVSLEIRRSPCIGSKAQGTIMFLNQVGQPLILFTYLTRLRTCSIVAILLRTFLKTSSTSRDTVDPEGK